MGDFNQDNDVDDDDLLGWHSGESPNLFSPANLESWEDNLA